MPNEPIKSSKRVLELAMAMLFLTGCAFGRITGRRAWVTGVWMVILGAVLTGLTMALGG